MAGNTVEIKVPAGRGQVRIEALVNAQWLQRVTIKPDGNPYGYEWTGAGEGDALIGATAMDRSQDRVIAATLEHSEDGGRTFKPSTLKVDTVQTPTRPARTITTISTEDGRDTDFNDSIVQFVY
ncbi:fucose-binding lectin II [Streptomyces synnematoformans]|uniref:Calcium-mediated lectin domain-containing protein n=1 Tax=Streptomyces synnematoformans TaxID=415721 RepID=A0ABN2YQ95_9ACTN